MHGPMEAQTSQDQAADDDTDRCGENKQQKHHWKCMMDPL